MCRHLPLPAYSIIRNGQKSSLRRCDLCKKISFENCCFCRGSLGLSVPRCRCCCRIRTQLVYGLPTPSGYHSFPLFSDVIPAERGPPGLVDPPVGLSIEVSPSFAAHSFAPLSLFSLLCLACLLVSLSLSRSILSFFFFCFFFWGFFFFASSFPLVVLSLAAR